jgi:hypothetical protein
MCLVHSGSEHVKYELAGHARDSSIYMYKNSYVYFLPSAMP